MVKHVDKRPTILVVEDAADHYLLLKLAAQRAGLVGHFHHAEEGGEAVRYLSGSGTFGDRTAHPLPALILADLKMPGMNGLDLLRWTRSQPLIKRIPFIMLSSSNHASDVNEAYDSGVTSYLAKPVGLDDLVAMLALLNDYWLGINQAPETNPICPQRPAEIQPASQSA
jgi:CheY-like chemotaxis protein